MMTSNKIVLILLVLLAVAFAVCVGTPLLTGSKDNTNKEMTQDEAIDRAKTLMNGWVGSLGKSFDFLSPALDVKRLAPPAPCRKGEKGFRLTNDTPCFVRISEKDEGIWDWTDFQKMVLKADSAGTRVQVCRCEKDDGATARGAGLRVNPGKLLKVSERLKFPSRIGGGVVLQRGPDLEISYFPAGEPVISECGSGKILVCEVVDAASLVVLDEGGTVRLACDGCTPAKPAAVRIE